MTSTDQSEENNVVPFVGKAISTKLSNDHKLTASRENNIASRSDKTLSNKFAKNHKLKAGKCRVQISRKVNPSRIVLRLFGKSHWICQWVIGLCESDPQFLLHLIDQSPDYVHFMCFVRLALLEQSMSEENQLRYATQIRTQSRKKIIKNLYPFVSGILSVLPKLHAKPLPKDDYRRIIRALTDDTMCKWLRHAKKIRKFDIRSFDLLENIPEEFRVSGVINCLKEYDDYENILLYIKMAQILNLEITQQEAGTATRGMDDIDQIQEWLVRKFEKLPFPPPPWPGNERIKPLCSKDEQKEVAAKFNNCIGRYLVNVVLGISYFYVCQRPPAVIEIKREAVFGWGVDEIKGMRNRDFSYIHEREIMQVFVDAGFLPFTTDDMRFNL